MDTPLYTVEQYTPEESIGYLLKRVQQQCTIAVDRGLAEFEMTHAQLGIFLKLLHKQANTAADLARELMADTGAMTRMLDRLEEKGFIQRTRSAVDRRVVEVALTAKGEQLGDKMVQVVVDTLNHHLRGFTENEATQFKQFLRRMLANA
jgi:DNA-binding MarR family transcriptional regulator